MELAAVVAAVGSTAVAYGSTAAAVESTALMHCSSNLSIIIILTHKTCKGDIISKQLSFLGTIIRIPCREL